jgi:hypothetical protein
MRILGRRPEPLEVMLERRLLNLDTWLTSRYDSAKNPVHDAETHGVQSAQDVPRFRRTVSALCISEASYGLTRAEDSSANHLTDV